MKFVDMKLSKESKDTMSKPMPVGDDYPYGVRLTLDNEQIEKLGLEDCDQGETVMLHAKAYVKRKSSSEEDGKTRTTMDIELRQIAIDGKDAEEYGAGFKAGSKKKA